MAAILPRPQCVKYPGSKPSNSGQPWLFAKICPYLHTSCQNISSLAWPIGGQMTDCDIVLPQYNLFEFLSRNTDKRCPITPNVGNIWGAFLSLNFDQCLAFVGFILYQISGVLIQKQVWRVETGNYIPQYLCNYLSLPLIPASGTTLLISSCHNWGGLCQKQVSRAGTSNYIPQYLWDVIICPCPWYLLLVQHSSWYHVIVASVIIILTVLIWLVWH